MANITGGSIGDSHALKSYAGALFTADAEQTILLPMLGGLKGGKKSGNAEFPVSQEFSYESLAQPAITETASLTAPNPVTYTRTQVVNTTQIFHEAVSLSYVKMAQNDRLAAAELGTTGYSYYDPNEQNPIQSELDFQIETQLKHIARDVEYTFINGAYQQATAVGTAAKSRGLMECASDASNTVAAGTTDLSKALLNQLFRTMYGNGATFSMPVIMVNAFQKQQISDIYGYAPQDRNIGGLNISTIETDFGVMGVVLSRFMDTDDLLVGDVAYLDTVFNEVPGKGLLFYEPLSKVGAKESGQIFGMIGLDHGPKWVHGSITGLTTS